MTTVHHDHDITWAYDRDMAITTRILPTQHFDGLQKCFEFSLELLNLKHLISGSLLNLQVPEHLPGALEQGGLKYLQMCWSHRF